MHRRAVLAVLLAGTVVGSGCSPRETTEPIWVGHLAPLSGPGRPAGEQARQGVLLAVEEARAAGQTVEGRNVAVRHADTRGEERTAGDEAVRLLAVNKVVALIAGPEAESAGALVRAARPYSAPVLVPGELAGEVPEDAFVLGARPASRGEALARFAAAQLGKRAAVLSDSRGAVAAALATAFVRAWPRAAGAAVEEWSYSGAADQPELVSRVAAWKPAVVLVAAPAPDLGQLRRRLRDAGVRAPLLYGGADVGPDGVRREAADDPDVYLASAYAAEGLTDKGKEFARRYEERFRAAPGLPAAEAYDAARWLLGVMSAAQAAGGSALREALARREPFEALTGTVSWKERQPRRRLFVVRLEKGRPKVVRTVAAEGE
jgi:branched-chain amino acid transport system substrate-binding protein